MLNKKSTHTIEDIEFTIIYSRRRTLAINIKPDASVTVRVPHLTSYSTISRIVNEKADWIRKHRANYTDNHNNSSQKTYTDGELHMYRGSLFNLKIKKKKKSYALFSEENIVVGLSKTSHLKEVKRVLYTGYKKEAEKIIPEFFQTITLRYKEYGFNPSRLIIRTMKRRWGSCSNKGVITLSTELIKLSDIYIEYVIIHELCHLKHHNHGTRYYKLLTELFPAWKQIRKEMKKYIQ